MDKIRLKIEYLLLIIIFLNNCTSDYSKNLGKGYFYRDEGGEIKDIFCEYPNCDDIPPTVVSFVYNSKFIIAKQKPLYPPDPLYKEYIYPNGIDTFYYWLIIKKEHLLFGPLSKLELDSLKIKYNVPKKLSLR